MAGVTSDKDPDAEYAIMPPDGGWGWVVAIAALYCNTVVDGILFTFGMYIIDIAKVYQTEESNIAHIGSLMYGVHLMAGPLCVALTKAFGLRPMVIFGSILLSATLASAYLEPPLWLLTILFGFLAGFGMCFVYMLSITATSMYFTRLRIFAVGIVVCGTGLGTVVFSQASRYMLKTMDWKQSHLLLSACSLGLVVAGLCFKPLQPLRINTSSRVNIEEIQSKVSLTSLWDEDDDEEEKDRNIVLLTKSRANSITSAYDATHVALGVLAEDLVEEKGFFKDNLAKTCGRCCSCFRQGTKVLLMHPKMKLDIMTKQVRNMKWSKKVIPGGYSGRWKLLKNSLKHMNWSLFKNGRFLLFCISTSLSATAIIIIFTFESVFFVSMGYTIDEATLMVTLLGASNMFWRLILGLICIYPKVNYRALNVVGHCLAGAMTIAWISNNNRNISYVYCVIVGLGLGSYAVFRPVFLLEIVGMDNLSDATGLTLFCNGLLAVFGASLGGLLHSFSGNPQLTYLLAGVLFLIAGVLLIFTSDLESVFPRKRRYSQPSTSQDLHQFT